MKEKIRYFYDVVVSGGLTDQVSEYISEDCSFRAGQQIFPAGLEGMKQHLIDVRKTYPDFQMKVIGQYCDGDTIISEFIMQGTHRGEWLGMKPTGKLLSFIGVNIDKVSNGKIVEHSGAMNTFETLFEAGIIVASPT